MNLNNHVRIYTTIREEAYANYESVTKPNLAGSVLRLSYTRDELQGMMQQLVRLYEGSDSVDSFFGLTGVHEHRRGSRGRLIRLRLAPYFGATSRSGHDLLRAI